MTEIVTLAIGALVGGAISWLTTNSRLRYELELLYDRDLRTRRVAAYNELWRRTKRITRYPISAEMTGATLREVRADWSDWYYEKGGIYMSEAVRSTYFEAADALQDGAGVAGGRELSSAEYDSVYAHVKALRDSLTGDIGARLEPRLSMITRASKWRRGTR